MLWTFTTHSHTRADRSQNSHNPGLSGAGESLQQPISALLIMSYCTLCRKYSLCAGSVSGERMGRGGGGWLPPTGYCTHGTAARLGCKRTTVGTWWANSHPGCMSRLLSPFRGFISGREGFLGSKWVFASREC